MRRGTFLHVSSKSKKNLNARYDKREIFIDKNGNYDTRPIHIVDGKAVNYRDPDIVVSKKLKKIQIDLGFEPVRRAVEKGIKKRAKI